MFVFNSTNIHQDFIFDITSSILSFVFLVLLMTISYKVVKIIKFSDKSILMLMVFLNLNLVLNVIYYAYGAMQDHKFRCFTDFELNCHLEFWYESAFVTTMIVLGHLFMINALLINIRNWTYYLIRIGEMAYHSQFENELEESELNPYLEKVYKRAKFLKRLLNWATFIVMLLFDCVYIVYMGVLSAVVNDGNDGKTKSNEIGELLGEFRIFSGVEYLVASSLFLLVGFVIQGRLKKYFPDFYGANKGVVWKAVLSLSISLIISAVQTLLFLDTSFRKLIYKYVQYWNISYLVFATLIPTCLQLTTLVFGYIRKKK